MSESIFGSDGAPRGNFQTGDYIDCSMIKWSNIPGYDYDHASNTARLAKFLAECNGFDSRQCRIIEAAATLHDVGRTREGDDPQHYRLGANLVKTILNSGSNYGAWSEEDSDEVARLVFKHGSREEGRSDKRLQCIQDADRLEVVRFDVGTKVSLARIAQTCKPDLFWTQFASTPSALKAWMRHRGWVL